AEDFGEKRTMGPDGYLTRPGQDPNVVPLSYLAAYSAMKWRNIGEKLATRRSIEVCQKALREAKEAASGIGARFVLLLIPDLKSERVGRSWLLRAYDRLLGGGGDINMQMETFAQSAGIRVVNLSPIFDRIADQDSVRIPGDGHFTREGHRLAGEALASV